MSIDIIDKTYVVKISCGLWHKQKYLDRINQGKGSQWRWPGNLVDGVQHNLPYKTDKTDLIDTLKPGTTVTIKDILYDARQTSRPGRFQCLEVIAHLPGGDKRGFVWTIYDGKTQVVPFIKKADKHKFQVINLKNVKKLKLRITVGASPMANTEYTVTVDGEDIKGTTDADGYINEKIPENATEGKLKLAGDPKEYKLKIQKIDSVETNAGIQIRLNNLGYECGAVDGSIGPKTKEAVKAFQSANGLEADGKPGKNTQAKLKEIYGS